MLKRAGEGDYRIQSLYGGYECDYAPEPRDLAKARAVIASLPFDDLLYSRIDMARLPTGELAVMEAEAIEPYLYPEQGRVWATSWQGLSSRACKEANMADKVFLVIGAGAGIGGHAAARFARGGYHAVLARRSDEEGLARLVGTIEDEGGKASGMLLDAAADGTIEQLVERVERDIGPIETVLYKPRSADREPDAGPHAASRVRAGLAAWVLRLVSPRPRCHAAYGGARERDDPRDFGNRRGAWQCRAAQPCCGDGARRMLCQTLNAEFAPQGLHVAHVVVDGSVDAPDTLGKLLGDRFEAYKGSEGRGRGNRSGHARRNLLALGAPAAQLLDSRTRRAPLHRRALVERQSAFGNRHQSEIEWSSALPLAPLFGGLEHFIGKLEFLELRGRFLVARLYIGMDRLGLRAPCFLDYGEFHIGIEVEHL